MKKTVDCKKIINEHSLTSLGAIEDYYESWFNEILPTTGVDACITHAACLSRQIMHSLYLSSFLSLSAAGHNTDFIDFTAKMQNK